MAMTDQPWGLKPLFMTEARKTALMFPITNNYGTAIYVQDPALLVTAGTIERGSTTGAIAGVVLGIYKQELPKSNCAERLTPVTYLSATIGTTYNYFALVAVDPSLFFVVQEDGDTSSLTFANNFGAVDLIYTHGGNTTTGISKCELDSSTIDATATRPMQLVMPWYNYYDITAGAYNTPSSAGAAGWYGKWICRIFNHQFGPGSLAVAFA
jgi:hypothetical protein